MNHAAHGPLTFAEAFNLPVTVDLRTAARAFGICTSTAYQLARMGTFPCPVLRISGRYRIPTAELMRVLGIEELPVYTMSLAPDLDS
jgi:Helix-turn-helix domain